MKNFNVLIKKISEHEIIQFSFIFKEKINSCKTLVCFLKPRNILENQNEMNYFEPIPGHPIFEINTSIISINDYFFILKLKNDSKFFVECLLNFLKAESKIKSGDKSISNYLEILKLQNQAKNIETNNIILYFLTIEKMNNFFYLNRINVKQFSISSKVNKITNFNYFIGKINFIIFKNSDTYHSINI